MAYAALVSLSQTIHLIRSYHDDDIAPEVQDQIISINESVVVLQEFLEHFPDKANSLETIIRSVAHVVEDVVEFYIHEPHSAVLESSVGPDNVNRSELCLKIEKAFFHVFEKLFGPSKPKLRQQPMARYKHLLYDFNDLKEATYEIESITKMVMRMKSRSIAKDERTGDSPAVNSSSSRASVHKDVMIGFEKDAKEIKTRLCGESSNLEVIPIVGMGGIGKTTLAKNVYDDPLTMEYFQIREWITVSQHYGVQDIISNLLVSMKEIITKDEAMDTLRVYKHLKGRKYLIVLDDVWNTRVWDDLKMMFPDDNNGSRIMITTRLSDVAAYPDPHIHAHKMHLMDEDQSWTLLRHKVFKKGQCPVELEAVGKVIARSCRGLPLATVVISGVLSSIDQTAISWRDTAKNVTTLISSNNDQFDRILYLSYTHLPYHLRPCFLYMGLFPEDYEIRASRLIKLWAADGFLKLNRCNKSSEEETAEENLEDLVKRSLVLVRKRKSDGRIKSLTMHDLMREMCIRIAEEENFFRRGHLSLQYANLPLHRFIGLIRILDLLDGDNYWSSSQISQLFNLRYLALNRHLAGIPSLQNLQTLILNAHASYDHSSCNQSNFYFPFLLEIWSMPQLRHLVLRAGFSFCLPPHQDGERRFCLENLQTLCVVLNFICTPEIVKTIPNVKKLEIWYSPCRDSEKDYQLQNLIHLKRLENLKLKIHDEFSSLEKVNPVFPVTLKKLSLSGLRLPWEEMKIVGSLPNLEVLKLRDDACKGDTWVTAEGEFPELKFLLIEESRLRHWITESSVPCVASLLGSNRDSK